MISFKIFKPNRNSIIIKLRIRKLIHQIKKHPRIKQGLSLGNRMPRWSYIIGFIAIICIVGVSLWFSSLSGATAQSISLNRNDYLDGTSKFGEIQIGADNANIQLQKGVVGKWSTNSGMQAMPSLSYGLSNLVYGPNDSLYLMSSLSGQCHFNKYDIERQAWTAANTPPVACGTGTILLYDGVSSFYYMPGGSSSTPSNRIFRYNISDDSWHQLKSFPSGVSDVSSGVFVSKGSNKYIYIFRGMGSSSFWRYSITGDDWQSMPSFPTTGNVSYGIATVWDGANSVYALVNNSGEYKKFDITAGTWTALTAVPDAGCQRHSLQSVRGTILAMRLGWCWERPSINSYDIASNSWTNLPTPPSTANVYDFTPPLAYDGSRYAYTILGAELRPQLYRYDTVNKSWDEDSILKPNIDNSQYHHGLIYDGSQTAYFVGGFWGNCLDRVYKYDLPTKQTTQVGSQINTLSGFSGVNHEGSLYLLPYPGYVTFQRYNTASNSFAALDNLPLYSTDGMDIVDGDDGYLYMTPGGRSSFYRYNITTDKWTTLNSMPQIISSGGNMTRIGRKLYVLSGGQSGVLLQYNMDTSIWSSITGMPSGDVDHGGFMISDDTRYLYIGVNGRINATAKKIYRYDTASSIWQRIADLPAATMPYASGFYDTNNNKLYVAQGQNTALLWNWSPGTTSYITSGDWYSKTYDLKQVQTWTSLQSTITGSGTTAIYTRSSSDSKIWSGWQKTDGTDITSPVNRYIQIKVSLSSDGTTTPTVSDISIHYDQETTPPNLPSQFNAKDKKGGTDLISGQTSESQHPYFSWDGANDGVNGSGVAGYYVYFGVDSNADPEVYGNYQTAQDYTVSSAMEAGGVYYLRIRAKDNLGNVSSAATYFSYRYFYISPPGSVVKTSSSDFSEGLNSNLTVSSGSVQLQSTSTGAWSTGSMIMPADNTVGGAQVIIGDYLYIARGSYTNTFWRYNLVTQAWTTLKPIPTTVAGGSSVTYDKNGNIYLIAGNNTNSFYRYNIENDVWAPISASLPSNAQSGTDITYIGKDRFVIMFTGVREFYLFDAALNQYTPLQSYPSSIDYSGSGIWFDGNDTIYAYLGSSYWWAQTGSGRSSMVKYSISNDNWRTLASPPVLASFTQNNLVSGGDGGLYIFTHNLADNLNAQQRSMRYDIGSDSWKEVPGMPDQAYNGSVTSDNKRYIYILPGGSGTDYRKIIRYDTWTNKYTPTTKQFDGLDRIPYDAPINAWQWIGGNSSSAVYDGLKYIYAIAGSEGSASYSKFAKFDYATGETIYLPPPPLIGVSGSLGYINGNVYYLPAKNTRDFYKFDDTLGQWIRMNEVPAAVYRPGPSSLVTVGSSFYVVIGNGKGFYKYTPDSSGGVWTKRTDTPDNVLNGATAYDAENNAIYVVAGNNTTSVYRYDITNNTWLTKAVLPLRTSQGAAMTIQGGKLYLQIGNITKSSYIYNIGDNSWSSGTDAPELFRYGSTILKISETTALAFAGEVTPDIWQFTYPSDTTAFNGLATHISQPIIVSGMYDYAGITAQVNIPSGTTVELWTRSSDDSNDWDDWTIANNIKKYTSSISGSVTSIPRKYTQIKVILQSDDNIYTPTVSSYSLDYYFDIDPPSNPSVIEVYTDDTKTKVADNNVWYNNDQPFFDWPDPGQPGGATDGPLGSNLAGYWVYLGTDITASPRTAGVFVKNTDFKANLSVSGTYYLRIQAQDMTGNIDSNVFAPYVYKFDKQPPTNPSLITVTPSGFTTKNNFSFEWPNSYDAHSGIAGYCYHTGATSGPFATEICQPGKTLNNISAAYRSGTNVFYLRSYDNAGNFSSSYTTVSFYYATDPPGPVSNLRAIPPVSIQNLFSYTWDLPTLFSGDPDQLIYCYSINVLPSPLNTTCTSDRFVSAFKAATQQGTNIMYMVAKDEAGNANWNNFAMTNFIANTVSPGIPLNLVVTDTSDRVTNRWSLTSTWDEPTFVGNGIKAYVVERSEDGRNFTRIGNTSTRAFVDLDVEPDIAYSYRVKASDNVDNEGGASGIVTRTAKGNYVTPPQIVVQPSAATGFDQANINWATSRESTSFVYYGTSPSDLGQSKGSLDLMTDHKQIVTGLQPSTVYYYRVQSFDNARTYQLNDSYSPIYTFKTTEAAKIYDVASSDITSNSMFINWKTSVPTRMRIEYGTSLDYGLVMDNESEDYIINHTLKIDDLASGSLYHFRITATTDFGSLIKSDDYSYKTIARPEISNVKFQPLNNEPSIAVRVTWKTNIPTSSTVRYDALGKRLESTLSDLSTSHEITLKDLASSTDYQVNIEGRDQYGNFVASAIQKWTSQLDTSPPTISNTSYGVTITESTKGNKAQLIVTWKTDEPSTSQLSYDLMKEKNLKNKTPLDTEPTTNHVVIISGLNLADVYKTQIISRDLNGNTVYGEITTLVTPDKEVSALDNILNLMLRLFTF